LSRPRLAQINGQKGLTVGRKTAGVTTASADSDASELDYSKSLQKLPGETFFRFAATYPDQNGTSIYVYRVSPVIDRTLAGLKDSNIDVISGSALARCAVDEEYLLRQHGSGKYHIKFTDANKARGATEVAKTTIDVFDPNIPPLLNPLELVVGAKGNDRWIQQYLREGWTVQDNRLTPPEKGADGSAVLAKTISEMAARPANSATSDALVNRALDVLSQRGGGDADIDRALAIAERLQPKADPTQVQLMQVMLQLVKGGGDSRPDPRPDPITQLKDTAALLKEFGWGQPAAAAGPSWTEAFAALPGILQFGTELLKQLALMRSADAAGGRVVPISGGPVVETAAAAAPTTQGDSMLGLGFNLADLKAVAEDALDAFLRGVPGEQFAAAVVSGRRNGEKLYETICDLGADQILQLLTVAPGVAERLGDRAADVPAWVKAFIEAGDEETGAGDAPAAGKVA
jgi:hypothetical protein